MQQPCGLHFSKTSSFPFSCNFHGCTAQGPASKTSERFRAPVSEAKYLRSASRILILFTYIIVNFLNHLHNPSYSYCMPNAVISPCTFFFCFVFDFPPFVCLFGALWFLVFLYFLTVLRGIGVRAFLKSRRK